MSNMTDHGSLQNLEIVFTGLLGADGKPIGELPDFAGNPKKLIALYRAMVLTRKLDEQAVALQRTGRLGTYASSLGQEAVGVGVAAAMSDNDVFLPSFREQGAQLVRGVSVLEILRYWGGDEQGSCFGGPKQDFPVAIPVASQFSHAAGVALAMKLRNESRAAVVVGGDGSTSKGDFYEALNLAGVWQLPVVFIINNNQWAISVPRKEQTAAKTLAQKAIAVGIAGEQVDGNDVIAVRFVVERALERARTGQGPSLIEALTYRLSDHTTADDATRYRPDEEVSAQWGKEPISRLRTYLSDLGAWTRKDEETLLGDSTAQVDEAVTAYLATPPSEADEMFKYLFESLPPDLEHQRNQVANLSKEKTDARS